MRTVPRLCKFYPDICLTTEENAQKNMRIISDFRRDVRSSLMWDVVQHGLVVTDVSVQTIGPVFKGHCLTLEDRLLRNTVNSQFTQRDVTEPAKISSVEYPVCRMRRRGELPLRRSENFSQSTGMIGFTYFRTLCHEIKVYFFIT